MRLPFFDFYEPSTIEEVLSLLDEHPGDSALLAGGTDLIPVMKYGLKTPSTVVGLKRMNSLKGISEKDGKVVIGAMTTLADLSKSKITIENFPALIQAVKAVAAPPLWNVATIGGNICQNSRCIYYNQSGAWRLEKPACFKAGGGVCHAVPKGNKCFSVYSGDLSPVLIALSGTVTVRSNRQSKALLLRDLFSGDGLSPFVLDKDELLIGVEIPLPAKRSGSSYVKMRVRASVDYPLISAAASLTCGEDRRIKKIRIVLGAVGPNPVVASNVEEFFVGKALDEIDFDSMAEIIGKGTQMVDNLMLPGSYRRKMLPVIAREAVTAAFHESWKGR